MRVVSLLALCACTGGPVLSSSVAYMRMPLSTDPQAVQLCRNGSAAVVTSYYFAGGYEIQGTVATITASSLELSGEEVFHFDLATLTLAEVPDPAPWLFDSEHAVDCDQQPGT